MLRYILGRLAQAVLNMLFIGTLIFVIVRLTGDPIAALVPESAPVALQERVREALGLSDPIIVQYLRYLNQLLHFDLGTSYTGQPVSAVLLKHLQATAMLGLVSAILSIAVGVPLGVISALRKGKFADLLARAIALFGQSVPNFWQAIMFVLVFAVILRWLPVAGMNGPRSYVLPAIAMSTAAIAGIARLTRSSMLEVLQTDYITMAHAKGLPPRVVLIKHCLRNALIPVVTFTGLLIGTLMNGSVVVESVMAWPGVGQMALNSVKLRDFPVVQGTVLMFAFFFIVFNLFVDILYAVVDPRINYSGSRSQ